MKMELDIRTVVADFGGGETDEVDVVVGDGKTVFDDNYPFDARIYFYFTNQAEYEKAKVEFDEMIGFTIVKELD
jgi:hypothetical protein